MEDSSSRLSSDTTTAVGWVLGPCVRPGQRIAAGAPADDWWREPHVMCTGSHHIGPGEPVICKCPCHGAHPVLRCPRRYDATARCTCPNGHHGDENAAFVAWTAEVEKDQAMLDAVFSEDTDA